MKKTKQKLARCINPSTPNSPPALHLMSGGGMRRLIAGRLHRDLRGNLPHPVIHENKLAPFN